MRHQPLYGEQELLQNIAGGDERAFRAIFYKYSDVLATYVLHVTRSYEVTEEVVQDVFLKIWMKREELAEVRDFRAYLFVMSRNYALNYLKKAAGMLLSDVETDWTAAENISALEHEEDAGYYHLIDEAIDQLPPQQQKVYLLSRHERLKYQEIAARLNLSRETVKKYLQLATEAVTTHLRKGIIVPILIFFQ